MAEEIFLNQMSTGAGSDIENATDLARRMVCEYGMSRLGPLTFGKKEEQIFLGREIAQHRDFSEETARQIDLEVRRLIDEAYQSAYTIINANQDAMHRIAAALLERETIDAEEVKMLIEGKELPPMRSPWLRPATAAAACSRCSSRIPRAAARSMGKARLRRHKTQWSVVSDQKGRSIRAALFIYGVGLCFFPGVAGHIKQHRRSPMQQRVIDLGVNPAEETIRLGPLAIHFLVTGNESGGSIAAFELVVPGAQRLAGSGPQPRRIRRDHLRRGGRVDLDR